MWIQTFRDVYDLREWLLWVADGRFSQCHTPVSQSLQPGLAERHSGVSTAQERLGSTFPSTGASTVVKSETAKPTDESLTRKGLSSRGDDWASRPAGQWEGPSGHSQPPLRLCASRTP